MNIQSTRLEKKFLFLIILIVTVFLQACQNTTISNYSVPILNDKAFPDYDSHNIESIDEIFALDQSIANFVESVTKNDLSDKAKLESLVYALFDRKALALSYLANANTTASDTYKNGDANCLSLTVLAFVMVQHLGMDAVFQDVIIPEFWTRRGGNTLINRHINLLVKTRNSTIHNENTRAITIDFDPQQARRNLNVRTLDKSQVASYFYTNKAADNMISNNNSKAYAYLRAAIEHDVNNESAWMNLGVLFAQNSHLDEAENYYQHAINLKPDFSSAYENLALLHKRLGDNKRASITLSKLHKERILNPYYHMMQGEVAAEANNYSEAIKHFRSAISLNNKPHEFHFALAKVYHAIGDVKNAKRFLERARLRTNDEKIGQRYASKMSILFASQ